MYDYISYYLYKYVFFYRYVVMFFWPGIIALFLILYIMLISKKKITGQQTALFGFILLTITMLCSIFQLDDAAGKIAEFVWILFTIAFIQEFSHFLKHENK